MANKTISDLTSGDPAQGSDAIPVQRGASNFKLTMSAVAAFTGANGPNIASKTIPANLTGSSAPTSPTTLVEIMNALQPSGTKWFVNSVNGNDSNTGTSPLNPFATVSKAQDIGAIGDSVSINDGYSQSTLFTVTKNLVFCSEGRVNFTGGVTIGEVNTRWEGYFYFAATNRPSLEFTGAANHFFEKISYYTTYSTGATQTTASSIFVSGLTTIFIGNIESGNLVTVTATPASVTRATHIYTTGSDAFNLTIANSTNHLSRLKNGIKYNIYYSDATSVYSNVNLNNFEIKEFNSGQNDSTINDLFVGDNNFGHPILVSNATYSSESVRIAGTKIRIANCDGGLYRACVIINNVNINPGNLISGDILLSNATNSTDICSIFGGFTFGDFKLTTSGSGVNMYLYYDKLGNSYTSNPPNQAFTTVISTSPITNNALKGRLQVQSVVLNAGANTSFRFNNTNITPDTPITFSPIITGINGVNIEMVGTSEATGYITIFIQNFGTTNFSGSISLDFDIRTNYM